MEFKIIIDNEPFIVDEKVYRLFEKMEDDARQSKKQEQIHYNALINSNKMLRQAQYYVARLSDGKDEQSSIWSIGAKLEVEWNAEVRNGLTGWLMENWPKICGVTCDCGNLISYDVVRRTSELLCNQCAPTGDNPARWTPVRSA